MTQASRLRDLDIAEEPSGPADAFSTMDPVAGDRFIGALYGGTVRILGFTRGTPLRHARYDGGEFTLDEVTLPRGVRLEAAPESGALVFEVVSGELRFTDDEGQSTLLSAGDSALAASGLPLTLHATQARIRIVGLAASLLRRVAGEQALLFQGSLEFQHRLPVDQAANDTWARCLRFVLETVWPSASGVGMLLVDACARTLAAAALTTFADSERSVTLATDDAQTPAQLKRAMWFINGKVDSDIGIQEIADAVHLSPRAVQYLFRRHLNTTPTEYVRRLRLHRAHQDLLAGSNGTATVSAIATRWGFAHTGRFAVLYRQTYGQSPHQTLRG
ncbi:AraC family transcriptional regulator [Mycolicibacterium lacusdiani]|uniref:AraC family transcriptional regulator n=1 Tax=Mycolicibacterium lacusdiani TaxID=2895283 RepID=UPI001F19D862|nr:AraC family transcriptional regulator [Mycolicibacterium lacusdiani]